MRLAQAVSNYCYKYTGDLSLPISILTGVLHPTDSYKVKLTLLDCPRMVQISRVWCLQRADQQYFVGSVLLEVSECRAWPLLSVMVCPSGPIDVKWQPSDICVKMNGPASCEARSAEAAMTCLAAE